MALEYAIARGVIVAKAAEEALAAVLRGKKPEQQLKVWNYLE